jgi:hypothetical protein
LILSHSFVSSLADVLGERVVLYCLNYIDHKDHPCKGKISVEEKNTIKLEAHLKAEVEKLLEMAETTFICKRDDQLFTQGGTPFSSSATIACVISS